MGKDKFVVKEQGEQLVLKDAQGKEQVFESKSALFRHLYDAEEMNVGQIAKLVGVRNQFVYSVIDAHTGGNVRKATETGESKSQHFREMWDQGMKVGQIAKETNSNYTFVHTVIKKYRAKQAAEKKAAQEAKKASSAQ